MSETICFSARLVQPFIRLLRQHPEYRKLAFARLESVAADERVLNSVGFECLTDAVERTGDPDIGLKAGRLMYVGAAGILDYVMQSAATVRESHEDAMQYARLYNDALLVSIHEDGTRALIRLDYKTPRIRTEADFTMSTWYVNHLCKKLWYDSSFECWFAHSQPPDIYEYQRTFAPAKLRFQAPCYGFTFKAEYLDAPLTDADTRIHTMLRTQLDVALGELSEARGPSATVRELLAKEISRGYLTPDTMPQHIRMTQRTLARRLDKKGTPFSKDLDELKRQLALRYVSREELSLGEVEFLLDFSDQSTFQRTFKRWTGQTPLQYRHAHER